MARLILHIGMSKAGSTAVQQSLAQNRQLLFASGIRYFDVVRGPNHGQLGVAFSGRTGSVARVFGVRHEEDRKRLRARLHRRLAKEVAPGSTWIASSEHIGSQLPRPAGIGALADFLGEFFAEVSVVIVVRRADYWLPSSYVESVKAGGVSPFDADFVHGRRRELNHRRYVRRWADAFGPENVVAVPFLESDIRSPAALPARFLRSVGVSDAALQPWRAPSRPVNESISAQATELLRLVNPSLDDNRLHPTRARKRAISLLGGAWPGPRTVLTPPAADALEAFGSMRAGVQVATDSPAASEWAAWAQQEPAPVGAAPEMGLRDLAAATTLLEYHRLIRHADRSPRLDQMTALLRQGLIRVARR